MLNDINSHAPVSSTKFNKGLVTSRTPFNVSQPSIQFSHKKQQGPDVSNISHLSHNTTQPALPFDSNQMKVL